jgi:hypothetical protein
MSVSPDGIFVVNKAGKFVDVNPAGLREDEDKYCIYKQFEVLYEGVFEYSKDNIHVLHKDDMVEYVIFINEKVYFYNKERDIILVCSKVSDVPTFVNIKP